MSMKHETHLKGAGASQSCHMRKKKLILYNAVSYIIGSYMLPLVLVLRVVLFYV